MLWEELIKSLCNFFDISLFSGVLPEVVAKWIASQAIPPTMLCLGDPSEKETQQKGKGDESPEVSKPEPANPIVGKL